ncbi:MAG TPA: class A beta-lactamase, partial [Burkholderiaceae bacterium]
TPAGLAQSGGTPYHASTSTTETVMTTNFSMSRRKLLAGIALAPAAALLTPPSLAASDNTQAAISQLNRLETKNDGRIGLVLLDAQGAILLQHRAEERFPMCSTFKMMLTACVLQRSASDAALMARHIDFDKHVLMYNSPVTEQHVGRGMNVQELCIAAMEHSDNAAANLLLAQIGGPGAVTAYARGLGDPDFYLVNEEGHLASGAPEEKNDTTTPHAMARSLHRLALGDGLPAAQRELLLEWMRANKTGSKRIRAAVPAGWLVGDKTGGGDYGSTNDIAVLERPGKPPLVLSIYFTQHRKDAPLRDEVVAAAARIALAELT